MNVFEISFANFFIISLISSVIVIIIGDFFLKLLAFPVFEKNFQIFLKFFFGIITLVTVFAIFKTNFNSIYTISFVLLGYWLYSSYEKIKINYKIDYKSILIYLIVFSVTYSLIYYSFVINNDYAVFGDNHFYAKLSDVVKNKAIETNNVDWTNKSYTYPYHYTEIWFTTIFSQLFSINTLHSYYFIYCLVFLITTFYGALALFHNVFGNKRVSEFLPYFASLLFLVIQIIDYPFNKTTILASFFYIGYPIHNVKLLIVYMIFITSFIFFRYKLFKETILVLLLLISFYSTITPSVLTGLFFVFVYLKYGKIISSKEFIKLIVLLFSIAFYYLFFYYFQEKVKVTPWDESRWIQFYDGLTKLTKIIIFLILILTLFFISFKYFIKKRFEKFPLFNNLDKKQISIILSFIFGGVSVTFLLFPIVNTISHDAFQLLSNFIIPIYTILFYVLIVNFSKRSNSLNLNIYFGVLFLYFLLLSVKNSPNAFNYYSYKDVDLNCDLDYFASIKKCIKNDKNPKFAFYRKYELDKVFKQKTFLFMPDNRIFHFCNDYMPLSLSVFDMPKGVDYRFANLEEHPFYRFVEDQKKNKTFDTIEISTFEFLRKYHINYIIVENGYICPEYISKRVTHVFKNKINNNRFLKIDLNF